MTKPNMPTKIVSIDMNPNIGGNPDLARRDRLISPVGRLDLGGLLKYLDWQAGTFAMSQLPKCVGAVTVGVQGSHLQGGLELDRAYHVNLVVTRSGGSSIEVQADLLGFPEVQPPSHLASFYFTFVAINNEGVPVPKAPVMVPGNEFEQKLLENSIKRKEDNVRRRDVYRGSADSPSYQSLDARLKKILREYRLSKPGYISSRETKFLIPSYARVSDRNIHGIVFGGQIIDNMFQYAWSCARTTIGKMTGSVAAMPLVTALNNVTFDTPVKPGYVTDYEVATVFSSEHSLAQRVTLTAYDSFGNGDPTQTNTAVFTFVPLDREHKEMRLPITVVPNGPEDVKSWREAYNNREQYKRTRERPLVIHDTTERLLSYR